MRPLFAVGAALLQHRQRAGRLGPPTPPHRLADRDLGGDCPSRCFALRVAARRPRRVVLVVSIAITVSGIFVALVLNAYLTTQPLVGGYDDAQVELLRQVLLVVDVILLSLAAVNAIFITWATVLDNRHLRWRAPSAQPLVK